MTAENIAKQVALQVLVLIVVGFLVRSSPALQRLIKGEDCGCSGR